MSSNLGHEIGHLIECDLRHAGRWIGRLEPGPGVRRLGRSICLGGSTSLGELLAKLLGLAGEAVDLLLQRLNVVGNAGAGPARRLLAAHRHGAGDTVEAQKGLACGGERIAAGSVGGEAGSTGEEDHDHGGRKNPRLHGSTSTVCSAEAIVVLSSALGKS
jgi:hypothetical protein